MGFLHRKVATQRYVPFFINTNPFQDDTVCDLHMILQKRFHRNSPQSAPAGSNGSQAPICQRLLPWTVPGALPTVAFWLAIILGNQKKKAKGKLRRSGKHGYNLFFYWVKFCQGRQGLLRFTGVLSTSWLWFSHATQMFGSGSALAPYGSTYSPGEENKWFVFLLWPLSLRTYKTSFWRLETCAWVEPDMSWHVSLECVAFPFSFCWIQLCTNRRSEDMVYLLWLDF